MKDIENPRLMYFKGALLLFLGVLASALLILEHPGFRTVLLLAIAVWAFARAYYFAFYVIEHYIDDRYQFAGLTSFVGYVWNRRKNNPTAGDTQLTPANPHVASPTSKDSDDG